MKKNIWFAKLYTKQRELILTFFIFLKSKSLLNNVLSFKMLIENILVAESQDKEP